MTTYLELPPSSGSSAFWGDSVATAANLIPSGNTTGAIVFVQDTSKFYEWNGAAWAILIDATADVTGPASATDTAIALFNGTTGKAIKNSVVTVDGSGNAAGFGTISSAEVTSSTLTASKVMVSGASKQMQTSATTATEVGFVSGVTSAIQTQLNAKQATGNYITSLTGDVTASGAGAAAATVVSVGGSLAAAIHTAELAANAAVATNTVSTIAKRDGSGNIAVASLTAETAALVGATGSPAASAALEVKSTTGCFLLPRMTTTQRDAITAINGCMIYNSSLDRMQVYTAGGWVSMNGWGN